MILNVQGSRYGGQFAINLGVQPLSIPDVWGQTVDPRKITESQCEFRRRLSDTGEDQWWTHDGSQEGMDDAVRQAVGVYATAGRKLLALMAADDSPVRSLKPADFAMFRAAFQGFAGTECRTALVLARVRLARDDHDQAHGFAAIALTHASPGSALRKEIEKLL